MFDGTSNVQLGEKLFKFQYPKLTVMSGVKYTVPLIFNYVSKTTIDNQTIALDKVVYNVFCSGIYYKPHSKFKFKIKFKYFNHKRIGVFSRNDTRMTEYFTEMHRGLCMEKVLQYIIFSVEFNNINCF